MRVAWHEVPGNALFGRSRPVGNGVIGLAPAAIQWVVSAFLCAGRFWLCCLTLKRVVLTPSTGAGETVSKKRSALAGPVVNNPLWGYSRRWKQLSTFSWF